MLTAEQMRLSDKLAACAVSFQNDILRIAEANGKAPVEVYALWRKYAEDCRTGDQSALLSEFLSWYRKGLPNLPEGMHRLG